MDIQPALFFFDHVQTVAGVETVIAQGEAAFEDFRIIGDDRTAFAAGGQVLGMAEVEAAHIADRARLFAVVKSAETFGAVFQHAQAVFLGDRHDPAHVRDDPIHVADHDRFRLVRDLLLDEFRIDRMGEVDIGEYRQCAQLQDRENRREIDVGRTNHFIARNHAQRRQRQMKRAVFVDRSHAVFGLMPGGKVLFELFPVRTAPVIQLRRLQRFRQLLIRLFRIYRPQRKCFRIQRGSTIDRQFFSHVHAPFFWLLHGELKFSKHHLLYIIFTTLQEAKPDFFEVF